MISLLQLFHDNWANGVGSPVYENNIEEEFSSDPLRTLEWYRINYTYPELKNERPKLHTHRYMKQGYKCIQHIYYTHT